MVTLPTWVRCRPLSSAWFSLQPGQFHRRWNHRRPAPSRPGALHPRLPRVAQVSADCELRSGYGRDERRSWGSSTSRSRPRSPIHHTRSLSRSYCWNTTGRPPRVSSTVPVGLVLDLVQQAGHSGVGQRPGLQSSFDHASDVQGLDAECMVLAD